MDERERERERKKERDSIIDNLAYDKVMDEEKEGKEDEFRFYSTSRKESKIISSFFIIISEMINHFSNFLKL